MKKDRDEKECKCRNGLSRRAFLKTVGAGAIAAAAAGQLSQESASAAEELEADEMARVALLVNGRRHRVIVEPRWSLLHVLREKLGLTGTKVGCERGECGTCTVLVNNVPRYACMMLAVEAEGLEIVTVEGLMKGDQLGPVQQAFLEDDAFQCGYCTPGQIMAVEGLLRGNPSPSPEEIRRGVSGNLCRCGTYQNIVRAAQRAAAQRHGRQVHYER